MEGGKEEREGKWEEEGEVKGGDCLQFLGGIIGPDYSYFILTLFILDKCHLLTQ